MMLVKQQDNNTTSPRKLSDNKRLIASNYSLQSSMTFDCVNNLVETNTNAKMTENIIYSNIPESIEQLDDNKRVTEQSSNEITMNRNGDLSPNFVNRFIYWFTRSTTTTVVLSPLQTSMRIASRRRQLQSVRFWYMIGSLTILLITCCFYCFGYMYVFWRESQTKIVYKVPLLNVPNSFDLIAQGSNDVLSNNNNLRSGHSHIHDLSTWMFGYETRPIMQSKETMRRRRHIAKQNREKQRTKHVMANFFTREFTANHNNDVETNSSSSNGDGSSIEQEDGYVDEQGVLQQHGNANPAIYGWTPSTYPNPRLDPLRCGISYIVDAHRHANSMSDNNYEYEVQGLPLGDILNGNESSIPFSSLNNHIGESSPPLRLCDPDWMLGGLLLEEVAASMYNFSDIFSQDDGEKPWDVAIGRTNMAKNVIWEWFESIISTIMQAFRWESDSSPKQLQQQEIPYEQVVSTTAAVPRVLPPVQLAVATVRKMNLLSVLRQGAYYAYEDQDDMVSDAAQIFARSLHDAWWNSNTGAGDNDDSTKRNHHPADYGILLFLSIQDRICFISTGNAVQHVLPWWRLDHIVASMKPDLRHQAYGTSVVTAIHDLTNMLLAGPPSFSDRFHDFVTRFGVVIAFAAFTFVFGAWGEYRDRRKRWQYAEQRSKLTDVEKDKALQMQKEYKTRNCPICLESFDYGDDKELETEENETMRTTSDESTAILSDAMKPDDSLRPSGLLSCTATSLILQPYGRNNSTLDKYGVPLRGADGKKIKILRCGHIFCEGCWKSWVHSGCGNPCNCPVCRQDVGKTVKNKHSSTRRSPRSTDDAADIHRMPHEGDDDHASIHSGDSASTLQGPYGDLNTSNDSVDDHFSESVNTRAASITLDMPLVGGGPSFLLSYAGILSSSSNANPARVETAIDGEDTPLLSNNNNENYTNISAIKQ